MERPVSTIRPYRDEDQAAVLALVADGLSELGYSLDRYLDRDLGDPGSSYLAVWVATDGAEVVGSVALRELAGAHPDEPGRVGELKRMFVRPSHRRCGLGSGLLKVALDWAANEGFDWARLDTGASMQAAQRFYEAHGFERCGSRTERGAAEARCEVLYRYRIR